ncbi:hypothetical protein [uncultured Methylophaga sp.]|uniref:hypothetical protein n=1 Tax=uncultured Methylophaga sp. TaxID=285271 RepID=UPI00260FD1C6|nr:hypothetical protein [uncultured Methylophaga sp.]
MKKSTTATGVALAFAAASMMGAATVNAAPSESANVHCYGVNVCKGHNDCKVSGNACKGQNDCKTADNACKGQADCKTAGNACAGQSSCKGQGFVAMSAEACDQIGGTVGK